MYLLVIYHKSAAEVVSGRVSLHVEHALHRLDTSKNKLLHSYCSTSTYVVVYNE